MSKLLFNSRFPLTKQNCGLSNVDNTSDLNKPISAATQTALNAKQDVLVSGGNIKTLNTISLLGAGNITLAPIDIGLANVNNTSDLNKPISTSTQQALNLKQDTLVSATNIKTLNSTSLLGAGNILLAKSDVGLGNVDNTSDLNKPISTATQTALNLLQPLNKKNQANGYAGLDATAKITTAQLPSLSLSSLADVSLTSAANTQVLAYNSANSMWQNSNLKTEFISINSNTTLLPNKNYLVNTSAGAITVTLPSSAAAGDTIVLYDSTFSWKSNNLTINPNSKKLNNTTSTLAINFTTEVQVVFSTANDGWILTWKNEMGTQIYNLNKIEFFMNAMWYPGSTSETTVPIVNTSYLRQDYNDNLFSVDNATNSVLLRLNNYPTLIYCTFAGGVGGTQNTGSVACRIKTELNGVVATIATGTTNTTNGGVPIFCQTANFTNLSNITSNANGYVVPTFSTIINNNNLQTVKIYATLQFSTASPSNKFDGCYFHLIVI